MIFKIKGIPLNSRAALGFRGSRTKRSCFKCGRTEEDNFDMDGKLQQLRVVSLNRNLNDTRQSNHIYTCARCGGR